MSFSTSVEGVHWWGALMLHNNKRNAEHQMPSINPALAERLQFLLISQQQILTEQLYLNRIA